jgi:hypothetical protein
MANNFLTLGTLAAFGWVFVNGSPPPAEPTARSPASRVGAADSSMSSDDTVGRSPVLEARQAPVPLVRNVRPPPATPSLAELPAVDAQQQGQDDLNKKAAKAAVEADGYKRVTVLGKAGNGAWRAKGFRGTTEVLLTVDGSGRVSVD